MIPKKHQGTWRALALRAACHSFILRLAACHLHSPRCAVQARSEEYGEAIAFVQLLNALWRGLGDALPNEGRGLAHLTKFVKDDVLATVFQRTYK